MAVVMVETARAAVTEAEKQYKAARRELASLLEARKPLVLGASSDGETSGELSENRNAIISAEIACRDAETRLDAARAALADAERAAVDAAAEEALTKAKALAAEVIQASEAFDQAMLAGANALERRERLRMALNQTGCMRAEVSSALDQRSRVRSAFAAAGFFHRYLNEFVATGQRHPLAETDRNTIALQKPERHEEAA